MLGALMIQPRAPIAERTVDRVAARCAVPVDLVRQTLSELEAPLPPLRHPGA